MQTAQRICQQTISPHLPHQAHPAAQPPSTLPPQQRPWKHPLPSSWSLRHCQFSSNQSPTRSSSACGVSILNDSLLPENLYPVENEASYSHSSSQMTRLWMMVTLSLPKTSIWQNAQCPDLASWMEDWNLYIQILVATYPDHALALLGYQAIICSASSHFTSRFWLTNSSAPKWWRI